MDGKGDDQLLNKKQLFIRNLPYTVTTEELEYIFQEIGPIKNISIATDQNGNSKGFGFVKFALEEDADIALKKLQGSSLQGRKISLEFGVKKEDNHKHKRKSSELTTDEVPTPLAPVNVVQHPSEVTKQRSSEEDDENKPHVNRSRQILVFGVPVDVSKKQFKIVISKICRKGLEAELIKQDHELSRSLSILNPPGKVMLLTLPSRQEATKAIETINKNTVKSLGFGKLLEKQQQQQQQAVDSDEEELGDEYDILKLKNRQGERLVARSLADITELELRKRKCRVIIRNLSFQATQQNIIDKLKRFGPISEVEIPTMTVNVPITDKMRERISGAPEDPGAMLSKEKMRGFAFVTFVCEADAKNVVENSSGLKICNRDVAIDFSMSKETFLKFGKEEPQSMENTNESIGNRGNDNDLKDSSGASNVDDDDDYENGNDEEIDEHDQRDDVDIDGDDHDDDDDSDDDNEESQSMDEGNGELEKDSKPFDEDVNECKTVFVRGLPFDAAPIDLKKALGKFGRIDMALIVIDKNTGISKGSAFVKFAESSSADKCLENSKDGLMIKDRTCKIDLAVDKDSAAKLKSENKVGKDKRNLYLANEGLVADNTQVLSDYDREKRLRAQSDKKKKLQNPLFFVSNNRLSIRNIGKQVTDNELRVACLKATKAGLEKGLVSSEDIKRAALAQGQQLTESEVPKFNGSNCIKSAKIMFDPNKVRGGIPQSRGYAFVQFCSHAYALACLRQLNNNAQFENLAAAGPVTKDNTTKSKLMVEFSLENIRKVKILREREERALQRREQQDLDLTGTKKSESQRKRKHKPASDGNEEVIPEVAEKKIKIETPPLEQQKTDTNGAKSKISSLKLQNKNKSRNRSEKSRI